MTAKALSTAVSLSVTLVYNRFAWGDFTIQINFPFKSKCKSKGPGALNQTDIDKAQVKNANKGAFSRTGRQGPDNKNPGPGAYRVVDKEGVGLREVDASGFPRGDRPVLFKG